MNRYIGIFDSGIGGLSVVKALTELAPNENVVYFGDTLNMPYGDKSIEEIKNLIFHDVDILLEYELKAIVIACGTASSIAAETLRQSYDLPIFDVIYPAARQAVSSSRNKKIGIIATKATVASKSFENAIHNISREIETFAIGCPKLANMIENGHFSSKDIELVRLLNEYLEPLKQANIDTLILGCTHYHLLIDVLHELMPGVNLVSSSACEAQAVYDYLKENRLLCDAGHEHKYLVSADPEGFSKIVSNFMKLDGPVLLKQ